MACTYTHAESPRGLQEKTLPIQHGCRIYPLHVQPIFMKKKKISLGRYCKLVFKHLRDFLGLFITLKKPQPLTQIYTAFIALIIHH